MCATHTWQALRNEPPECLWLALRETKLPCERRLAFPDMLTAVFSCRLFFHSSVGMSAPPCTSSPRTDYIYSVYTAFLGRVPFLTRTCIFHSVLRKLN